MIYLKLTMAVILSAVPFIIYLLSFLKNEDKVLAMIPTVMSTNCCFLKRYIIRIIIWCLEYSCLIMIFDSYRKFFTCIFMLIICAYGFVDFCASEDAEALVEEYVHVDTCEFAEQCMYNAVYIPGFLMMTSHVVSIAVFIFIICMSFHSSADRILLFAGSKNSIFFIFAILDVIFVLMPHTFIVGEVLFILLIASFLYPEKVMKTLPKGRKPLPIKPPLQIAA